jgi:uncharacterized protein YndB with AHSA1/START domain
MGFRVRSERTTKGDTPLATATVSPNQDAVLAEIFIAAPPERVFEAITDPSQLARWWGQSGLYRVTESTSDVRPGGKWSSAGVGADGTKFRVDGEYLEVDPPRRLVHTWNPSYRAGLKTVVYWDLEPQSVHGLHPSGPKKAGVGTLVKLRHEGFGSDEQACRDHGEGWKRVLGWLVAFVERGETVDTRK